ncbi:hypothetical protein [Streptomyces reticuli]|uniref:hypothetical protein n=1 Tax=Streptomyces reticuli TaxID=1926 RepID=UPI00073DF23A|nr:hypothetical protein [Streptomyces sp. SID7810]CUW31719.1 hypothetical protein TUE45_06468 [Streptomyces reticuli]
MSLTSLTAYQLSELLRRVDPHIARNSDHGGIEGVHLDYNGKHLHAVATDRYTLAVARERAVGIAPAWKLTISAAEWTDNVTALRAWADAHPGGENVHLSASADELTVSSNRSKLVLQASSGYFPEWRDLIRTALNHAPTESPWSGWRTRLLARWQEVGDGITTWQPAFDKPVVIYATNFVGLQMPRRIGDDESPAGRWESWKGSLGETGPTVEQEQTLHHWEAAALEEKDHLVETYIEDLLKQTLRSTTDIFKVATGDTGALAAYALAGTQSWLAYRLLKVMEKAAPDLLRKTLDDVTQQCESGEINEWARDEAEKAGFDPQKWHDEYEAHLKKLADERAAETAA